MVCSKGMKCSSSRRGSMKPTTVRVFNTASKMKRNGSLLASEMAQQIQTRNKQTKEIIMNQSTKRGLFFVIAVIFLLTPCGPSGSAPTQDPAFVQQLIQQSVALTVAAQSAQTTAA